LTADFGIAHQVVWIGLHCRSGNCCLTSIVKPPRMERTT
jgi:hypothetical protein